MDYEQGAGAYAVHRRAHEPLVRVLAGRCQGGPDFRVLEVGCGTGNYANALAARLGCSLYGLDPAAGMLIQARGRSRAVSWLQGRAEALPLALGSVDLIYSVDVIHHVADKAAFFQGAARLLRPGGWVCTATDSEEIIQRREILSGYFPETVPVELARYPRIGELQAWMADAGLGEMAVIPVEESYEVTSAQAFRDKAFSSLHLIAESAWQRGLARLEADLTTGAVRGVARYACVWGQRMGI
jgi:ubiquinone/menaquinone biosynthesis C-methylase UbiE